MEIKTNFQNNNFYIFLISQKLSLNQTNKFTDIFQKYMLDEKINTCCYGNKVKHLKK